MYVFFNIHISNFWPIFGWFRVYCWVYHITTFATFSNLEARKLLDQMVAAGGVTDVITYNTLAKVGGAKCCDSHVVPFGLQHAVCGWLIS